MVIIIAIFSFLKMCRHLTLYIYMHKLSICSDLIFIRQIIYSVSFGHRMEYKQFVLLTAA